MVGLISLAAAPQASLLLPADVYASGLITSRTFFDDFTSSQTIDTLDTGRAGFNWYVHRRWPNAASPFAAWTDITTNPSTTPASISIANSILTLSAYPGGRTGNTLSTAVYNSGTGYKGTVFGGGAYFEFKMAFDPSLARSGIEMWPAVWSSSIEFMTGSATRFAELDVFEAIPTGTGTMAGAMTLHDWDNVAQTDTANTNNFPSFGSPDYTQMHSYGLWWLPASKNGGVGQIRQYFDNTMLIQNTYSATSSASPAFGNGNPVGALSILDSQNLALHITSGTNWPATFDSVSVWQ